MQPRMSEAAHGRQRPTRQAGIGEPLTVGHGDTRRLLAYGAGLCSPGLWPPERRHPPAGLAAKLHEALDYELTKLGQTHSAGLDGILADIAVGRSKEDSFQSEATERLRAYIKDLKRVEAPPS